MLTIRSWLKREGRPAWCALAVLALAIVLWWAHSTPQAHEMHEGSMEESLRTAISICLAIGIAYAGVKRMGGSLPGRRWFEARGLYRLTAGDCPSASGPDRATARAGPVSLGVLRL
ncbi:hypothetical protein HJD18_02740 [Thermoleophilia bacterium SCSIO 60948]|nr:hypothetical protein HJD18_02740 [Thermoleophilia bacterium SCSIO 60948]